MKIALFGGSFDPVHFGHLIAAQDVLEQFVLDRIIFVPAAQAPLKAQNVVATAADRLAMVRAAIDGNPKMEISECEIGRGSVSYTIDTVRYFRKRYPKDDLYWVLGGDQLSLLSKWKEIGELVQLIEFVVMERPGFAASLLPEIPSLVLHRGKGHLFDISSTELRQRSGHRLSLKYFIPQKVIAYIEENGLYR